jgi:hypothetical protein
MRETLVILPILLMTLSQAQASEADQGSSNTQLPPLQQPGEPYETPLAGEGFRAEAFGKTIEVEPSDLRSISAWHAGIIASPGLSQREASPLGLIYLWRRPDEDHLFRAAIAGLFNEAVYAVSPEGFGGYEALFTFESFSPPYDQAEFIDGEWIQREEVSWGYARGGLGIGHRETVGPAPDNMRTFSLNLEPGYFFFGESHDSADEFEEPNSTFETRLHAKFGWDALTRNFLKLPHEGFAFGTDLIAAHRYDWDDWGLDGREDGSDHENYTLATAFMSAAWGVPGIDSDRHRLLATLHGGLGSDLDRFSAPRISGGPQEAEHFAVARPVLPGAAFREFFPRSYAIATGEYRFEPIFFAYLGLRGSVAYLDRARLLNDESEDDVRRKSDVLSSLGLRLTSGFLFETRLQVESNYNFGVIREGDYGGFNGLILLSGEF